MSNSGGCSIRAIWILNPQHSVVYSRRFPVVDRRWRAACKMQEMEDDCVVPVLPSHSELATAFADRKTREGSTRGFGIRVVQSVKGSDSWVDDPITRHIISLSIKREPEGEDQLLWPLILHVKGHFCILVLPSVEPRHLKAYAKMCKRPDCGSAVGEDESLSSLLLELPSMTGALMVAHAIGDIITGDIVEPEVVVNVGPSVGGLLDTLTGSIGISARAKPVAAPVVASSPLGTSVTGALSADVPKIGNRLLDKDALRTYISIAMPFGTPLDLNYSNVSAVKNNGFLSSDLPPADHKQPAWKPYLYKGKQRLLFTIQETVNAAMYDRDEIPDNISISGQVNCRAELEGLPDVLFPLTGLDTARVEVLSFHPCAQVPEQGGGDKQSVMFNPPLGAFLFKLRLMEGYKAPLTMEVCSVTMPFPKRRVIHFDGTPSVGTVTYTDHSVEWKILTSGRGVSGKSIEATFPGSVKFAPWQHKSGSSGSGYGILADEDSDVEESSNNMANVEDFLMEKMNKDLKSVDLEEPFCWQAYNYAKVSFKMVGASLSGMSIDPKSINIFPPVKAPVEFSTQVVSGDYILWNTLGKCPVAARGEFMC
ncbi:AP-5 complex subunit mu [Heracleum sosnowskyi]|uniref:AP-5 complex subunit mu n=1 Tax=Heracleum sosnowskyi TaxID=360622 RepID=A0AAD8MWK1_9APIA|nr:AP-5 complex subunit mu [Heracleum sosnowskyi]